MLFLFILISNLIFDLRSAMGTRSLISPAELRRDVLDAIVTQNQVFQTGEVSHLRWDRGDQVSTQIQHLQTGQKTSVVQQFCIAEFMQ